MTSPPRGLAKLAARITEIVREVRLDLRGCHVLTEAATGAYVVTPVIAAVAGTRVTALTKESPYGTVRQVRDETEALARELGVAERITIVTALSPELITSADIVTNSGHLRPLDAALIQHLKRGAVIPLMYENWEFRTADVDLAACQKQGVLVGGTNEKHAELRVFDYLGMLAVHGLFQCEVPVALSRILLVCDNPFGPFIARTLERCGATVEWLGMNRANSDWPKKVRCRTANEPNDYDAVVVADTPTTRPTIGKKNDAKYTLRQLGTFPVLVQVWGDIDRGIIPTVKCYPAKQPAKGHMGILLSALGPEPIVRLQAGGLKAAEEMLSGASEAAGYCQPLFAPESRD
jgi:hypothetical protein